MKLLDRTGADPRNRLSEADLFDAASFRALPHVARPSREGDSLGLILGILGALALGAITFATLANHRTAPAPQIATPAPVTQVEEDEPQPEAPLPLETDPALDMDMPPMEAAESQAMPMVLDNTAVRSADAVPAEATERGATPGEASAAFGLRAGGQAGPARATRPENLSTTVVEGTIIPAVLETALNSDHPGHARAIVSRDVRSFDGSAVLIPRGSRLVGQYRSATEGQSRAFIVWSRLIRPDGMSIELASPAVDASGAAGVAGDVDRHTLRRFGSALLLSIIGALPALADAGSPTVVIGAPMQNAASEAAQSSARTAPTIRVPIGTPIQVFTARDLSFD
ncbi:MAG: TrbI/VirB10 family protein [Vitreimonas sp.]